MNQIAPYHNDEFLRVVKLLQRIHPEEVRNVLDHLEDEFTDG